MTKNAVAYHKIFLFAKGKVFLPQFFNQNSM